MNKIGKGHRESETGQVKDQIQIGPWSGYNSDQVRRAVDLSDMVMIETHTDTHAHTRTRTHTRTHAHAHVQLARCVPQCESKYEVLRYAVAA